MAVCKECSHRAVCALFKPGGWVTCPFYEKTIDAIAVEIFEDIEKHLLCGNPVYYVGEAQKIIAELKKKYTEVRNENI